MEAVASVLTLAVALQHVAKRLIRYSKRVTHARDDIRKLGKETRTFASLLKIFHSTLRGVADIAPTEFSHTIKKSKVGRDIEAAGRDCIAKLKPIINQVQDLRHDSEATKYQRMKARFWWSINREEIMSILLDMSSIKSSATMLTAMINLGKDVASIKKLKAIDMPIPKDLTDSVNFLRQEKLDLEADRRDLEVEYTRLRQRLDQPQLGRLACKFMDLAQDMVEEYIATQPVVETIWRDRSKGVPRVLETSNPDVSEDFGIDGLRVAPLRVPGLSSSTTEATKSSLSSASTPIPAIHSNDSIAIIDEEEHAHDSVEDGGVVEVPTALFGPPDAGTCRARQRPCDDATADEPVIHSPSEGVIREFRRRPHQTKR